MSFVTVAIGAAGCVTRAQERKAAGLPPEPQRSREREPELQRQVIDDTAVAALTGYAIGLATHSQHDTSSTFNAPEFNPATFNAPEFNAGGGGDFGGGGADGSW